LRRVQTDHLHVVRHHLDAPGPPVVIVHGAPDRSKNFAHVIHRLSDLAVTVYDRRGYGKSLAAGAGGGGFDTHADDLVALLGSTPSVVVGQSAGGAIAMTAAARSPELFLAVGAWEPPMTPYDWWPGEMRAQTSAWASAPDARALGESFNRELLGDERFEQLSERTLEMLRSEGKAFRSDMASQDRPYFDPADLTVPTLIGCGTSLGADPRFADVHRLSAERTGSELLVIEGASHSAHIQEPGAWVLLVRATIELARRGAPRL
jgi:pimeloyl-ACP methyl ester carboxylesterase